VPNWLLAMEAYSRISLDETRLFSLQEMLVFLSLALPQKVLINEHVMTDN